MPDEPTAIIASTPPSVAPDSSDWMARLPDEERRGVCIRIEAMRMIAEASSVHAGARAAADRFRGVHGFSWKRLYGIFTDWDSHGRDDRRLANWSRFPWLRAQVEGRAIESNTNFEPAFIEHVGGLFLSNKRSMGAAWRDLVSTWRRSWHSDEKIPGYGSARDYWRAIDPRTLSAETCPPDLPHGWTKSNLMKVALAWCNITPAEVALARRGTAAMRAELPTVHTSRVGVEFGQHLYVDDLHHDLEVIVPGFDPPNQRPLEIGILDFASACYGPFVTQPTLPNDDGTKRMLGWDCVKWAFGSWLEQNGLPLDWPIHLHVERGTATVNPDEARFWHQISNGIINVCYTEMQGKYCLAWDEKRIGNFRGKAALESAWNLHHAYEAALPGYVGRNRDNCPAQLHGQRREALAILAHAATLPIEERAKLQLPLLTYDQFVQERLDIVERINHRDDHQLEAFNQITTWRPQGMHCDWRSLAELESVPVGAREFVEYNTRLETPAERRAALRARGRWAACPPHWLAMIYAFRATPLTVAKGTIHVRRGTSHWWFMADSRADQIAAKIEDGREYLVAFNPFSMTCCHILDPDGKAYLATWRQRGHRKGDKDASAKSIAHRMGLQREVEQRVERLFIASGQTPDTDLRRLHNRELGAPADIARINVLHSAPPTEPGNGAASDPTTGVDPDRLLSSQRTPADTASAEADSSGATTIASRVESAEPLDADAEALTTRRRGISDHIVDGHHRASAQSAADTADRTRRRARARAAAVTIMGNVGQPQRSAPAVGRRASSLILNQYLKAQGDQPDDSCT